MVCEQHLKIDNNNQSCHSSRLEIIWHVRNTNVDDDDDDDDKCDIFSN